MVQIVTKNSIHELSKLVKTLLNDWHFRNEYPTSLRGPHSLVRLVIKLEFTIMFRHRMV